MIPSPELAALLLIAFFLYSLVVVSIGWYLWNWHYYTRQDKRTPIREWNHQVWCEVTEPEADGSWHGDNTTDYRLSSPSASIYRRRPGSIKAVPVISHPLQ